MGDFFETLIKIILTVGLCIVIGIEREGKKKGAGVRTHILVGVGSCLIVLTSFFIFDIYKDTTTIDPTRLIAGLITGIGFLCGGTIIRSTPQISGLTTAATLWIVSGIGISVGAGHYSAAITVTIVVFFVLVGMRSFGKSIAEKFENNT